MVTAPRIGGIDRRLPALDGLRAVAAMTVLISHAGNLGIFPENRGNGQLGVMLFFVLSGFLMGHIYITSRDKIFSVIDFYIKRLFRVVPLFVVVVVVSYIINLSVPGYLFPITAENFLAHLTFRDGVWVLWTIPVELKFYLLFPAIGIPLVMIGDRRTRFWIMTAWLVMSFFAGRSGKFAVVTYLNFFVFGVWLALFRELIQARLSSILVTLMIPLWMVIFVLIMPRTGLGLPLWGPEWWHDIPYLIWAGLGVLMCTQNVPIIKMLFANAPIRYIGGISYALYLLHYPVIRQMNRLEIPDITKFPLFLVIVIMIASASTFLFERPMQDFGKSLSSRIKDQRRYDSVLADTSRDAS